MTATTDVWHSRICMATKHGRLECAKENDENMCTGMEKMMMTYDTEKNLRTGHRWLGRSHRLPYVYNYISGCWFEPLSKILVNWDDYSQYYGKIKNVPNHQPDIITAMYCKPIGFSFWDLEICEQPMSVPERCFRWSFCCDNAVSLLTAHKHK